MNYGLYLSASGAMTNLYRQDVYANNLANVNTVGYKADFADLRQRAPEAVEDRLGFDVSHRLLDRLGGGVLAGPQRIDMSPGQLTETGNPLDVALAEEGQFFAVRTTDSQTGEAQVRLTRDGRFTRNDAGQLVNVTGHPVLDADDDPITLPDGGPLRIDAAGRVLVGGEPAARLQVAEVADPQQLEKLGAGLFAFDGADPRQVLDNPSVKAGFVEASGVDPITTLMRLIGATKSVASNAQMMRHHDNLMDKAVNSLGRVA
ncbi:MAG: flagellar hook-basal body protein [Phycisphaeraceae bacterium]